MQYGPPPPNELAFCFDADGTLLPGYMQTALFDRYQIDERQFWQEVGERNGALRNAGIDHEPDCEYLHHIVDYTQPGMPMEGLTNGILREVGAGVATYDGVEDLFRSLKDTASVPSWRAEEVRVRVYIISTGIKEMILGTGVCRARDERGHPLVDGVWGGEFAPELDRLGDPDAPIKRVVYEMDGTKKTQILYRIHKGANINPEIDVDLPVPEGLEKVPWRNMVYVGDSRTDIPAMSMTKSRQGTTIAVHDPSSAQRRQQAEQLLHQGRAIYVQPADYSSSSDLSNRLLDLRDRICDRIVGERQAHRSTYHGKPITHHDDGLQDRRRRLGGVGGVGR